jgi:type IV secretion system protein VirB9
MKKTVTLLSIIFTFTVNAINSPEPDPNDGRLKTVIYKQNDIIPINAIYKKATYIDLGEGNTIIDIAAGDTESWMFETTDAQDGILAKPVMYEADTNLIVITAKRKYFFDLHRSTKKDETYGVRFVYPDEEYQKLRNKVRREKGSTVNSDLEIEKSTPDDWNFGYLLKGSKQTAPVNIFDDGKFTYLDFGKKEVPAMFSVDMNQRESVVNFHKSGKYLVVENVFRQLTMRNGDTTTCIYNKTYDDNFNIDSEMMNEASLDEGQGDD